jgi:hypothetical protein
MNPLNAFGIAGLVWFVFSLTTLLIVRIQLIDRDCATDKNVFGAKIICAVLALIPALFTFLALV